MYPPIVGRLSTTPSHDGLAGTPVASVELLRIAAGIVDEGESRRTRSVFPGFGETETAMAALQATCHLMVMRLVVEGLVDQQFTMANGGKAEQSENGTVNVFQDWMTGCVFSDG